PGLVRTPMSEAFYQAPGVLERREAAVPLRRVATPADIADGGGFLASERARYVTGPEIRGGGGVAPTPLSHRPRPRFCGAGRQLRRSDAMRPVMNKSMWLRFLAVFLASVFLAAPVGAAPCGGDFNAFLSAAARDAAAAGVSRSVIDNAFAGLTLDPSVLAFDR